MFWNALQAKTVKYLTDSTGAIEWGKTLLEKVYNAYTVEGILTAIDYNVDTEEYTYTVDGKEYTTTQDFSALFAMNVTVLAKDDEALLVRINKGGVVVNVKGVKVFVPRSQATMRRDEDYTALVGQHVQLVVTECSGRKIVGSINKVTAEQNKAKREEFWANVEVGKTYTGVVKSLTSYGAFVDIGGVDGLCHISELSWNRIKHPSEVVSVGDTIEVYVKDIDTAVSYTHLTLPTKA